MTPLAAIHVAKKQLGMDEDTYRAFLRRETGKDSARDMSEPERLKVVSAFRAAGFASTPTRPGKPGHPPRKGEGKAPAFVRKAQALWIATWNLGLVANCTDKALAAFVKRQTGLDRPEWVKDARAQRAVVEALKGMTGRAGVDWTEDGRDPAMARPGYRIARAQFVILKEAGGCPGVNSLLHWLTAVMRRPSGQTVERMTDADWIAVMNTLGIEIRTRKGGAA